MGFYNVVKPCVVARRHHVRPTTQPIEVDDDTAAPLVESGCLTPYRPGGVEGKTGAVLEGIQQTVRDLGGDFAEIGQQAAEEFAEATGVLEQDEGEAAESEAAESEPKPKPRRPRRNAED